MWITLLLACSLGFAAELCIMFVLPALAGRVEGIEATLLDSVLVGLVLVPCVVLLTLRRHRGSAAPDPSPIKNDPAMRLRGVYIASMLAIAALVLIRQRGLESEITRCTAAAERASRARAQIALCDRLAEEARALAQEPADPARIWELSRSARELEQHGRAGALVPADNAAIERTRRAIIESADAMVRVARGGARDPLTLGTYNLDEHGARFIELMERAESDLGEELRGQVGRAAGRARTTSWITLGALALLGLAAGEPAVRRVSRVHRALRAQRLELERVLAERTAAMEEARFRQLAMDRHGICSEADAKGKITFVNEEFCRISGYSRRELLGKDHKILNSGTHPRSFWKEMYAAMAREGVWTGLVCNRRKDGGLYWVQSTNVAARGADGRIERYISMRADVTDEVVHGQELARARDTAEAASRAKSDFLANMSHEIRTPMTAILGYLDLLFDGRAASALAPQSQEHVEAIRRNGEHLLAVINDILDMARIESDKLTIEKIATDPVGLAQEVASIMRPSAAGKKVVLELAWDGPMPRTILADPLRLRQILLNLVGNAIKFTEQGTITLTGRLETGREGSRQIAFAVRDTGIGATTEQTRRFFGAFEQADASMSRRYGGSGLGLRISKRLAELMGGDIDARCEVGSGCEFVARLPALWEGPLELFLPSDLSPDHEQPLAPPAQDRPADRPLAGVRVLLAEDGPDNQRLITFHLEKAGAQVGVVDNGRKVVEVLSQGTAPGASLRSSPPCDVILLDMQMPEMDGYATARLLRSKGCTLPIIALTAHAMSGDREKCLAAGCTDYAAKPIDREALIASCAAAAKASKALVSAA